jgi:putative transcriptional regulator
MTTKKATTNRAKRISPVEASLMRAADEAEALLAGDTTVATIKRVTARTATAPKAPAVTPRAVKQLRVQLGLSQPVFAEALNVSPDTVKGWEQGKKHPSGPAERLLEIATEHPTWITDRVMSRH